MPRTDFAGTPRRRLLLFGALYFAQGVPWGFVTVTLALYLTQRGLGGDAIGRALALCYLPWSFKPLFGPLVDRIDLGRLGRRRPWILAAEAGMAATLVGLAGVDPASAMPTFLALIFVHNLLAAAQDVGSDALAIEILPESERGTANSVMWASKYAGALAGGAGLTQVARFAGWRTLFLLMAGLVALAAIFPLLLREPPLPAAARAPTPHRRWSPLDWTIHAAALLLLVAGAAVLYDRETWVRAVVYTVLVAVLVAAARTFLPGATPPRSAVITGTLRSLVVPASFFALLFALAADFSSSFMFPMLVPFVKRTLGFTDGEVGRLIFLTGLMPVLGALAGGTLSDRIGRRRALALFAGMVAASHLAFALTAPLWQSRTLVYAYSAGSALFHGMLQATILSLLMDVSNPRVGGTQFTVYMAVVNVKNTWTSYAGGAAALALPPAGLFAAAAAFEVLPLALLPLIDPRRAAAAFRRMAGEAGTP